ncbi:MAG: L-histidine N(alpha)-methyltransferase [Bacteroidales bacterium]
MTTALQLTDFARDTLTGLSAPRKYLHAKHLYDDNGSKIFQQIMNMPEYYPTGCEHEIFSGQSAAISSHLRQDNSFFRLIELGPGDGLKSRILLKQLAGQKTGFSYMPVDISGHAIQQLVNCIRGEMNGLKIEDRVGDYMQVMQEINNQDPMPKVILFLGGNIGNFSEQELDDFLNQLQAITRKGDKVLMGFDLKKSPDIIMNAYDDPHGHTRDFNLNHLVRINRELDADFNPDLFSHHCCYDPRSGAMESFLVSSRQMTVHIGALEKDIHFKPWESIFMELSRKYDLPEISQMAFGHGFEIKETFTDSRNFFVDSLWIKKEDQL